MSLQNSTHPISLFLSLSREKGCVALATVCMGLATILHLLFAWFAGGLVDGTMLARKGLEKVDAMMPEWSVDRVCLTMMATVLVVVFLSWIEYAWYTAAGEKAATSLRKQVFENLIELPMAFFHRHRGGELASHTMSDVMLLQEFWIHDLRLILKSSLLILGGMLMMFFLSVKLALVAVTAFPAVAIFSMLLGRKIRKKTSRATDELAKSSVVVEEAIRGIAGIKTHTNEVWEKDRYARTLTDYVSTANSAGRARAAFICTAILIVFLVMVFLMWFGSKEISQGRLSPGEFTSFMFALGFVGSSGGAMAELFAKLHRVSGASERLVLILSEKPEPVAADTDPRRIEGKVEFRDVCFSYESRKDVPVLQEVSLKVSPGETIALVGPSGSGKSTIVSLLFRLYEPGSGEILIDGRNSSDFSLHELRSQMALVPQEIMLIGGTIWENIEYGRPDADREEIRQAAQLALVDDFVKDLPDGYETRVGDRGMQLSGGQRQRVAIARAILRDPAILVLDEATSSLDSQNEIAVQDALDEVSKNRTTFVIAHRLATVAKADRIVVLADGKVVQEGVGKDLANDDGLFRLLSEIG